ncbi:isoprenyl transferase [Bauldia sp.]|uniref:isoprenyl transferase n=1 Tax=Bauldia sp. TaxID=2575872 RepID=UPI003BABFD83
MRAQATEQTVVAETGGAAEPPTHIGIIMDGNGRWAVARGLPRSEGHRRGVEAVRRTVDAAARLGVRYLTLFSFSSENWARPPAEVDFLLGLLRIFIRRDLAKLHSQGVRVRMIGNRVGLPRDIAELIRQAEDQTDGNAGLQLFVAFNYGGREEMVRAVRKVAAEAISGELSPDAIDETTIARHLDTADVPDPDMIIRTSGEMRLSNFLLWQSAYAELVFVPIYWPDFDGAALQSAIDQFSSRSRRYGGVAG